MNAIQQITADPYQTQTVNLLDGTKFSFTLRFIPMQYAWVFTNLTYNSFVINGLKITNNLNILNQYRKRIPFGIQCISSSQREPTQQLDFTTGATILYVLRSDEVQSIAEFYSNG